MSERVANSEIEDVLLSIRRLVQGDTDAAAASGRYEDPASTPATRPVAPPLSEAENDLPGENDIDDLSEIAAEALVLTPALRVDDSDRHSATSPEDELRFEPEEPPVDSVAPAARLHFQPPFDDAPDNSVDETGSSDDDAPEAAPSDAPDAVSWRYDDAEEIDGADRTETDALQSDQLEDLGPDMPEEDAPTEPTGETDDEPISFIAARSPREGDEDVPSFVRAVVGDMGRLQRDQSGGLEPMPISEPANPEPEGEHADLADEGVDVDDETEGAGSMEDTPVDRPADTRSAPRAGFRFGSEDEAGVRNLVSFYGKEGLDLTAQQDAPPSDDTTGAGIDASVPDDDGEDDRESDLLMSIVSTFDEMDRDIAGFSAESLDADEDDTIVETAFGQAVDANDPDPELAAQADPVIAPIRPVEDVELVRAPAGTGAERLDEARLAELVAECVHRELQGELGERITRNVRKLVRREIHRALSMRDFD